MLVSRVSFVDRFVGAAINPITLIALHLHHAVWQHGVRFVDSNPHPSMIGELSSVTHSLRISLKNCRLR